MAIKGTSWWSARGGVVQRDQAITSLSPPRTAKPFINVLLLFLVVIPKKLLRGVLTQWFQIRVGRIRRANTRIIIIRPRVVTEETTMSMERPLTPRRRKCQVVRGFGALVAAEILQATWTDDHNNRQIIESQIIFATNFFQNNRNTHLTPLHPFLISKLTDSQN